MIRTIVFLAKLLVLGLIVLWVVDQSGPVTATWTLGGESYRIYTNSGWVLLLAVLAVMAIWLLAQGWNALARWPERIGHRRERKRLEKSLEAMAQGYLALSAGDVKAATAQAARIDRLMDNPQATLLLKAETARVAGDESRAKELYTRMLEHEGLEPAGLRGLLSQAQKEGRLDEALSLARRVHERMPKAPWALTALFDLLVKNRHWTEAAETLKTMTKQKILPTDTVRRYSVALAVEMSREAEAIGYTDEARKHAARATSLDPGHVPAALQYARLLLAAGKASRTLRVLEAAWQKNPHPDVARLYMGLGQGLKPLGRVKQAERLLALAADNPESHLALAETALEAQLWGEARNHLMRAVALSPSARAFRLLARLDSEERRDAESARQWLEKAVSAGPDPLWSCGTCGTETPSWQAVCSHCQSFDTVTWTPPRASTAVQPLPRLPDGI
ncbi:MAG: tetratricopeptide repeat protein [Pseudomonadota bacterium]|nr:tetratricopeptide repeat protein [Pseudomonadota bacterium]